MGAQRSAAGFSGRPVLLVPVPSSRAAVRARGHDPTYRLAWVAARVLRREGMAVECVRAVAQVRRVADQSGLPAVERMRNLAGALVAGPVVRGRQVVLVDDVITTGASLVEAARAVEAAGGVVLAAATVAATPRRGSPDGLLR